MVEFLRMNRASAIFCGPSATSPDARTVRMYGAGCGGHHVAEREGHPMRMRRRVALPVGILLLLAALAAPLSARGAQDAQADLRDRALAAAAAQNLFGLAAQGNYIGMVDELHPDAMAVFPRAAAAGEPAR